MILNIILTGAVKCDTSIDIPEPIAGGTIRIPVEIKRSPVSDILTDYHVMVNDVGGIKAGSNIGGLTCKEIIREIFSPATISNFHLSGGYPGEMVLPIGKNLPNTIKFTFNSIIDDYNKNFLINLYMNDSLVNSGKLSDLAISCKSCGVTGSPEMVNERVVFKLELVNAIGGITSLKYTVRWGGDVSYFIAPHNVDIDSDVFKYYLNGTQQILNDLTMDIDVVGCSNSTDRLYIVIPIEYGTKTRFIGMTDLTANLVNFEMVREGVFLKNGVWTNSRVYKSSETLVYTKFRVKP